METHSFTALARVSQGSNDDENPGNLTAHRQILW